MVEKVASKIFVVIGYDTDTRWLAKAYRDEGVALDNAWYSKQEDARAGLKTKYAVEECELVEVMPSMEP